MYDKAREIDTLGLVYEILQNYAAQPEKFESTEFTQLLDKAVEIGIARHEEPRMYKLLKKVMGIKLGSPQEALYELDNRVEGYLTDKLKSDLVIVDNTKDVLNNGYVVDEAWMAPPPDEQPASEWFDACF